MNKAGPRAKIASASSHEFVSFGDKAGGGSQIDGDAQMRGLAGP